MRCEIITIISDNYGNRLQNYALQEHLKKMGAEVTTNLISKKPLANKLVTILRTIRNKNRGDKFAAFNRKYIRFRYCKSAKESNRRDIDFFVAGSDQIWNPYFDFNTDREFLFFAEDKKRVSYAASFGVASIPSAQRMTLGERLMHFKKISVREKTGADIVEGLTGIRPAVVIDPTLLLNKEDWAKISKKPSGEKFENDYLLTYFLGKPQKATLAHVKRISNDYGLEIKPLLDPNDPNLLNIGPSEFVYLIEHAKLIITDSFHACVLSFLFGKPFLVYDRIGEKSDMFTRMETLFDMFDLRRKYVSSGLDNHLFECDYSKGYSRLEDERKKANDFLNAAFGNTKV